MSQTKIQGSPLDIMHDFDPSAHVGNMPSPCINICQMNASTGWCEGCYRTIDEIVQWGSASEAYKRTTWVEIKRRQHDAEQGMFS